MRAAITSIPPSDAARLNSGHLLSRSPSGWVDGQNARPVLDRACACSCEAARHQKQAVLRDMAVGFVSSMSQEDDPVPDPQTNTRRKSTRLRAICDGQMMIGMRFGSTVERGQGCSKPRPSSPWLPVPAHTHPSPPASASNASSHVKPLAVVLQARSQPSS
eukprot:3940880-Rhodomonas_salina.3